MQRKKTILLKITGEILLSPSSGKLDKTHLCSLAEQIKQLRDTHYFGIVSGGGNFFRGSVQGKHLGITPTIGHQVGMLATMMNGLLIQDIFEQHGVPSSVFCAVPSPEIGKPISQQSIQTAKEKGQCMIFTGGTGNPFFTTDTTAILRGLQIDAEEIWKGTTVNGIYTKDPRKFPDAQFMPEVSHKDALALDLKIMDAAAFALAAQHNMMIRIFDIFSSTPLLNPAHDSTFGSKVC